MKCGYCGNDFAESQHHYCPEGQRFLLAELSRLRAVNAELVEAMTRLADEKYWRDQSIMLGAFTAAVMVDIASAALSRAEQAKPETCVWYFTDPDNDVWTAECGAEYVFNVEGPVENEYLFCPGCGKRIEVRS